MKFFVTIQDGVLESAIERIKMNGGEILFNTRGKICFESDKTDVWKGLKFVERLFVAVFKKWTPNGFKEWNDDQKKLEALCGSKTDMEGLIETWKLFQAKPENDDEVPVKKAKLDPDVISFRISCKATGSYRKKVNAEALSRKLGFILRNSLGRENWIPELRNPALDISLHINDEGIFMGFPITKVPLSRRKYILHENLRGPVCDLVIAKADVKNGDYILDPCCGAGTILFEALSEHPFQFGIGCDISTTALDLCRENKAHFLTQRNGVLVDFVQADATNLPFRAEIFDSITTDVPFGKKHEATDDIPKFYNKLTHSLKQVLTRKGSAAILCNPLYYKDLMQDTEGTKIDLKLGETPATLVIFNKESLPL